MIGPSFVLAVGVGLGAVGLVPSDTERAGPSEVGLPDGAELLAAFEGAAPRLDPLSGEWRTVNDNIMGGRSSGGGVMRDGALLFAGSTNTDGGGFSSVRASDRAWDLAGFDGLSARVQADGRTYVFHVYTGLTYNNGSVFYRGEFETEPAVVPEKDVRPLEEPWEQVFVAFEDFVPMVRGRAVTGRVESLDPSKVQSIGLMIDDGVDGPFRLHADWVAAVESED